MGVTVPVELFMFLAGKSMVGSPGGCMRTPVDLPRYVDMYMKGEIPLDKLITHHFKLEDINDAVDALKKGEAIKAVIIP